MTDTIAATKPRLPVTAFFTASFFFSGITYASTLPYGGIVGIETLGIPSASYALILMVGSIISAAAAVVLGWLSDRVRDRRIIVIGCALMGALGWGLLYTFRSPLAFIVAICLIMPFGHALFSQSFSYARSYYNARSPDRAEFMVTILRTVFSVAWAIVPPVVGWVAAVTSVFEVYGVAALAYIACAVVYATLLAEPTAKVGVPPRTSDTPAETAPKIRVELPVLGGIGGVVLIMIAIFLNNITTPLVIVSTLGGTLAELGIFSGLAAALEVPFMVVWAYAQRRIPKHAIIVIVSLIYAVYLALLSQATSVEHVYWLQLVNCVATAGLMGIPIGYLQEAIKGRVGLSTSLLSVTNVTAALVASLIFGAVTGTGAHYPAVLVVASGIAALGAAIMFAAHRFIKSRPEESDAA